MALEIRGGGADPEADRLAAVVIGETEPPVEARAQQIAVEHHGDPALGVKRVFQRRRERAFARAAESVEPEDAGTLTELLFAGTASEEPDVAGR